MGLWANWFRQREEIRRLEIALEYATQRQDDLAALLNREETRNALLEKSVTKEYADHKLTLRRVADQASKQLGLPQHFVRDGESRPVSPPPPGLEPPSEDAYVLWQAQAQRDADIEAGINPAPLQHYIDIIKEAPNKYVIG